MSITNNDELAQLKQLATFMIERFSMNPVSCKILNEDWKKRFPDDVSVAETLVSLLAERDADKKRIAELEALTAEQDKRLIAYAAIATKNASEARSVSVKPAEQYEDDSALLFTIDLNDDSEDYQTAQWLKELRRRRAAGIKLEVGE